MEYAKSWALYLSLIWTVIRCATTNHSILLDSINKEFGVRLKKLSNDYYMPRKNTFNEILEKKLVHAGHDRTSKDIQKSYFHINSPNTKNTSQKFQHFLYSKPSLNNTKNSEKQNLVRSQNLYFNNIEPFWPFSNLSASFLDQGFHKPKDQNSGFPYNTLPNHFKDTTFFFSHVGPNRFEYRAQFHHSPNGLHQPKDFKPFVHEFPEFPKINFPNYPSVPGIFPPQPQFPSFPEFNGFTFPTLPPPIKRNLDTPSEPRVPDHRFGNPFHSYNSILNDVGSKYPKIFRFNEERINIEDFEREKKRQVKLNGLNHNLIQPENVQRNHLLILHGGIFTVQEPPLYQRKIIRKRRQRLRKRTGKF